ncbi:MAG: hypothetical protein ACREUG_11815, partial [Steroidobacteraceae bacterium]
PVFRSYILDDLLGPSGNSPVFSPRPRRFDPNDLEMAPEAMKHLVPWHPNASPAIRNQSDDPDPL